MKVLYLSIKIMSSLPSSRIILHQRMGASCSQSSKKKAAQEVAQTQNEQNTSVAEQQKKTSVEADGNRLSAKNRETFSQTSEDFLLSTEKIFVSLGNLNSGSNQRQNQNLPELMITDENAEATLTKHSNSEWWSVLSHSSCVKIASQQTRRQKEKIRLPFIIGNFHLRTCDEGT